MMTLVHLRLPADVTSQLVLPRPDHRDVNFVVVGIEGLTVTASVVTLTALRPQFGRLAAALRGWVLRQPVDVPVRLAVKGKGLDLRVELPPNVSRAEILKALQPLVEDEDDQGQG
jgi:hypothetical protein